MDMTYTMLLLVAAVAGVRGRTSHDFQTTVMPLLTECKLEIGASDEDVNTLLNLHDVHTPKGKCLIDCTNRKVGILKGTRFTRYAENTELYDNFFSKDEKLKNALRDLDKCIKRAEAENSKVPCTPSYTYYKCLLSY